MTRPRAVTGPARLLAVGLLLGLAACSSGEPGSGASSGVAADGGAESAGAGPATGDVGPSGDAGPSADLTVADEPRRIRRGSVTVEVDDLAKAANQVRDATDAAAGYVSDESIGLQGSPEPFADGSGVETPAPPPVSGPGEARLVVRVPQESMREVMDTVAALGVEVSRWSTETEVETALVDLESRVATQTASVERVRTLLDRAESIADVVSLESELSRREADLESIAAQQQALAGRAAMATVTAVLLAPDAEPVQQVDQDGFLAGLGSGWDALAASTVIVLTVLGALFPFAIVLAVIAVPVVLWRRRTHQGRPAEQLSSPARP